MRYSTKQRIRGANGVYKNPIYIKGATSKKIGHGIVDTIMKLALGAASSYAANKGLQTVEGIIKGPMQEPQVMSDKPAAQGVLKGDILPPAANVTVVNPNNHTINLGNGYEKQTSNLVTTTAPRRRYGGGMKKGSKQGNGILEDIISSKSQEILNNLKTGKGLYKL
jgi:hypothetical protein